MIKNGLHDQYYRCIHLVIEILNNMTHADSIVSSYVLLTTNVLSFEENVTILQLIFSYTETKCNSECYVIKSKYARYIAEMNNTSNPTLLLNDIRLLKIKNYLFQKNSQPTVPRFTGNIYVCCTSVIKLANITKSISTIIKGYYIYTPLATLTNKPCRPAMTVRYKFDKNMSLNHRHRLINKEYNHTYDNEVCAYDFHKHCCAESVSERTICISKKTNTNNNKKQIIVRNSRTSYRSPIVSGYSGGTLATQVYGSLMQYMLLLLLSLSQVCWAQALLIEPRYAGLADDDFVSDSTNNAFANASIVGGTNRITTKTVSGLGGGSENAGIIDSPTSGVISYMNKMNNLERSVAAVLIKVAYGTTSTTKRSIPDNNYVATVTTIATPLLTTLRYVDRPSHQQEQNIHLRNYELDLERDHALPTSAPNADILKSNNNPTYPNPNRHYNHERDRQRHILNTTPLPTLPNLLRKNNGQLYNIPIYPGDIPSYSPPARSFFTPPLPPEYQSPFADKPTLRGTNNDGIISNTGSYINRRPIPPPSLMPGHERVPYRPPDLVSSTGGSNSQDGPDVVLSDGERRSTASIRIGTFTDIDLKTALNTPSQNIDGYAYAKHRSSNDSSVEISSIDTNKNLYNSSATPETLGLNNDHTQKHSTGQEFLPGIQRILSGSNGNKGEVPEVLLKQVTSRPIFSFNTPPSSPIVLLNSTSKLQIENGDDNEISSTSNINKSKSISPADFETVDSIENKFIMKSKMYENSNNGYIGISQAVGSTSVTVAQIGVAGGTDSAAATSTMSSATLAKNSKFLAKSANGNIENGTASSTSSSIAASVSLSTWAVAWNIHIYFSVVLFTILAVYSFYKVFTYNKLTHLFSQSYFMCIHMILILICSLRIFYLCYDAYNIHATFNFFVSEVLLNMPATFLTISFSVLMLYLFLKTLNQKNNRYSALIRPLTVVIGCSVHVVLCITLHYVESYTINNHMQQQFLYQQQQQLYRRQQLYHHHLPNQREFTALPTSNILTPAISGIAYASSVLQSAAGTSPIAINGTLPPRVLSLLCQIIYIFICFFLGLLYLYLYRVLKQILKNKSQNYIHGYQNLSYAIHITIATALLFVLLAALQIFGAISLSTTRPLLQKVTAEIDWLQWGYQFSLRVIEIAIIILLLWVAGLETGSGSSVDSAAITMSNRDTHYGLSGENGGESVVFGSAISANNRDKYVHHQFHHNHSNVAGFFLPCTSSSSQEQFETDYPTVCNANTNLHTYTMRTGRLIYDDAFALNSLSGNKQSQLLNGGNNTITTSSGSTRNVGECHLLPQSTYQRPYDSGSPNSGRTNHDVGEHCSQGILTGRGSGCYNHETRGYTDYLRDVSSDHYENPNMDLRYSVSSSGFGVALSKDIGDQKFPKTSTTSTAASSSGGSGSSAVSQQQILLLQSESCYSEPLHPVNGSRYNFNNVESAMLSVGAGNNGARPAGYWLEPHHGLALPRVLDSYKSKQQKKMHKTLDRNTYENPERRSSKSTNVNTSRCGVYNSYDRGLYNGILKSGTLNNISDGNVSKIGIICGPNSTSSSGAASNASAEYTSDTHTADLTSDHQHRNECGNSTSMSLERKRDHDRERERDHLTRSSLDRKIPQQQIEPQWHQNSTNDVLCSDSNVEYPNKMDFKDGSYIINSNSTSTCGSRRRINETKTDNNNTSGVNLLSKTVYKNDTHSNTLMLLNSSDSHSQLRCASSKQEEEEKQETALLTLNASLGPPNSNTSTSSISNTIGSEPIGAERVNNRSDKTVVVAKQGFVRFRAIDDMNNAQGIGIHNASIRN